MDEKLMMQIVEAVVRELQGEIPAAAPQTPVSKDGFKKMLVIGDASRIPEQHRELFECFDIEDYKTHQNIYRYQKVMITSITLSQLSDIAQGRDGSPEACAVIHALLTGIEVGMLEEALGYRKFAGKSSSRLYQVLENNARLIQTYGVKLIKPEHKAVIRPAVPPKYQAPKLEVPRGNAQPNPERLITEDVARKLAAPGDKVLVIPANAIVTPSAWDYFKVQGIEVVRQ